MITKSPGLFRAFDFAVPDQSVGAADDDSAQQRLRPELAVYVEQAKALARGRTNSNVPASAGYISSCCARRANE